MMFTILKFFFKGLSELVVTFEATSQRTLILQTEVRTLELSQETRTLILNAEDRTLKA